MKIKFVRPFRFVGNNPDDGSDSTVSVGHIVDLENDESAQWLIDNGFAEEVKESGWWKPKYCEKYFYMGHDDSVYHCVWINDSSDNGRLKLGSVFKTEEAAMRYRDYLGAIATVRQDEGVIDLQEVRERCETGSEHDDVYVYTIAYDFYKRKLVVISSFDCMSANGIWFDTMDHADTSLDKHPDEWKIIANYDWSRE